MSRGRWPLVFFILSLGGGVLADFSPLGKAQNLFRESMEILRDISGPVEMMVDDITEHSAIPAADDFFMDSVEVRQRQVPILMMFSTPGCSYCEVLKEEVIAPMAALPEYRDKVIIRHINAASLEEINNFYNQRVSKNDFAFQYAVDFFPTVILVDNYGVPLDKVVGVSNMDFYWSELDKKIDTATESLAKKMQAKL